MKRAIAVAILALAATRAGAQGCYPGNNPTLAVTSVQVLDPSQVPFAAVTVTVSPIDGSEPSHAATIGLGTSGQFTRMRISYKAYNTASLSLYNSWDNGPLNFWFTPSGTSGSFEYDSWSGWPVGHVLNIKIVGTEKPGSGSPTPTTQDVIKITTTPQAPGFYYWDGNDSNIYDAVTIQYLGFPQISFADCPSMRTAHHTPTANLQLQNVSSGELRNTITNAGPTVSAGNSVQASVTDYISALPGSTITGTFGGITFCDVDDVNFFGLQSFFRIEGAKVVVKDLGHPPRVGNEKPVPSSIYDVAAICQNNCDPPDWEPTVVHSFVGRQTYWIGECQMLRMPDLDGVPWTPLCEFMNDASGAFGQGLIPTTIQLATGGLSLPYPGPAPDLPIPGKCTKYPVNVLFTVGPKDLANWFKNIPN